MAILANPTYIDAAAEQKCDFTQNLKVLATNVAKINRLLDACYSESEENNRAQAIQQVMSPDFALKFIDANASIQDSVLSDGDVDVLMLIGDGMSHHEVSEELGLTTNEMNNLMQEIVKKIGPALMNVP